MSHSRVRVALAFAILLLGVAATASGTTLIRSSLDELVSSNETIVVGEVVESTSYWNADGSFILTDVVVKPLETLKGNPDEVVTLTLMGGTVGDLTTLILGGSVLIPGRSYLLFLNREDLPGARGALTVRDHCQGTFDIELEKDGELRAVSQALEHPLLPDARGQSQAPGGTAGFSLESLVDSIRDAVASDASGKEVTR